MIISPDSENISPEDVQKAIGLDAIAEQMHLVLWGYHKRISHFEPTDWNKLTIEAVSESGETIKLKNVGIYPVKPEILLSGKGLRVAYAVQAKLEWKNFYCLTYEYAEEKMTIKITCHERGKRIHFIVTSIEITKPTKVN